MAKISAHDSNNGFATGPTGTTAGTGVAWAHGWTNQADIKATVVKATGGTYGLEAPEVEEVVEVKPKRATKKK